MAEITGNPYVDAGLAIAPAILSFFGGRETNTLNLQIAREQMKFQETMSNTAVSSNRS